MTDVVRRVLNIGYYIKNQKVKAGLLALDVFKAFDCVEWPTLKILIEKLGSGKKIRKVINKLYSENKARIVINDGDTETITLSQRTRQGCPLSLILFALLMEVLANAIRKDSLIEGIGVYKKTKINLFADDTLLTFQNPIATIERVYSHLNEFGKYSGLQINWEKSEMMLYNHSKEEMDVLKEKYKLKMVGSIKYLGIDIPKNIQELKKINYEKLKKDIKDKIDKYGKVKLSWFIRIAAIKMKVLPKINFLFWMIPIKFSDQELKKIQGVMEVYCNGGKRARISKALWYEPLKKGGLGLPNVRNYWVANQLRMVPDIIAVNRDLLWSDIELKELREIGDPIETY
ncbi:hypothetical protein NXF25_012584 [Crotalus adamanteus]|uniref:Reverse transcriptase domain-containing protein n=1 Tax=Crotalus adamanteus TaxID=8729 RepID=A0AAW1BBY0_CROAD